MRQGAMPISQMLRQLRFTLLALLSSHFPSLYLMLLYLLALSITGSTASHCPGR